MATINLGEVGALTNKYFVPKLVDNIFSSNALLQRAKKKWMEVIDGGTQIVQPVAYAVTSAAGWYSGTDTLSVTANDQIDNCVFDWAFAYASIPISRTDELKNTGKQQIINFVKAKVQLAEKTLADTIGTGLYQGAASSQQIVGLDTALSIDRSYGSIDSTTYTWWDAMVDSTTTAVTVGSLQALIGDCTVGNDRPTVCMTNQNVYDDIFSLLQPQQRFVDENTANAGFQNILFAGIPVIVDSHVAGTNDLMFLNEDYCHLFVHKDENFRFEPFIKATNQAVSVARVYWAGCLLIDNPRMCGAMSGL